MSEKCLFLPLKGSKSHAKYYFRTRGGPIHLPINYRNFAQSPFNPCPGINPQSWSASWLNYSWVDVFNGVVLLIFTCLDVLVPHDGDRLVPNGGNKLVTHGGDVLVLCGLQPDFKMNKILRNFVKRKKKKNYSQGSYWDIACYFFLEIHKSVYSIAYS